MLCSLRIDTQLLDSENAHYNLEIPRLHREHTWNHISCVGTLTVLGDYEWHVCSVNVSVGSGVTAGHTGSSDQEIVLVGKVT